MKLDENTRLLLKEYGKFNERGLLTSLDCLNMQLVNAVDAELLCPIHDELVDRRDMYNEANPKKWFDKCCCYSLKEWRLERRDFIKRYKILQKNEVFSTIASDTIKFWDRNIYDETQEALNSYEVLIKGNRNEYFEDEEEGTYGFRPSIDFYIDILCGNFEIVAGDRTIICRTVKKGDELVFMREEKDKEIGFNVEQSGGKLIEWTLNGECIHKAEIDPLYKSMYNVYVHYPEGITDAALAANDKLINLYRKITVGDANKERIDAKNIKDYVSRLNKELFYNGIPKEYRISKEGNVRFIPYLKYLFKE